MENRFKKLRMEKNPNEMEDYKIKDLSGKLGIAAPKISELEHGRRASLTELQAYHHYFNVPYEYLLGEKDSRYYECMVASSDLGLSGEAIKEIQRITQNKTLARIINQIIEKYLYVLLSEISNGTTYMELINSTLTNGLNADTLGIYNDSLKNAEIKAMESMQEITNQTGHVMRLVTGNENITYCKLKASEIIQNAVGEILYHWKSQ